MFLTHVQLIELGMEFSAVQHILTADTRKKDLLNALNDSVVDWMKVGCELFGADLDSIAVLRINDILLTTTEADRSWPEPRHQLTAAGPPGWIPGRLH